MTGIVPTEGRSLIAKLVFKNVDTDRGTGFELGLFTNASITAATTLADITEPTGGGYARKSLADASWTELDGVVSYATQSFTALSSAYSATVKGYFVATTGTTPRLLYIEQDVENAPVTIGIGTTYIVVPHAEVS